MDVFALRAETIHEVVCNLHFVFALLLMSKEDFYLL